MSKVITIQRGVHDKDKPYFLCRRDTAQDRNLSFEARGMLWYLLSKPDDWKVQPSDLEQQCGSNRVYRILNELISAKYIVREAKRENGKISSWTYFVYEQPLHDFQEVEKPQIENSDYTKYREEQNTEKDSAPVSQDATPIPVPVEPDAPPTRKRKPDPVFDKIAECGFGIGGQLKIANSRVAKMAKLARGAWQDIYGERDDDRLGRALSAFYRTYIDKGLTPPGGADLFDLRFRAFLQSAKEKSTKPAGKVIPQEVLNGLMPTGLDTPFSKVQKHA